MSKLVPEVRVNKNGVSVKKYVRADGKGKRQSKPLPKPEVPDKFGLLREEFASIVWDELSEGEYDDTTVSIPANLKRYIEKTFSNETVAAYVQAMKDEPDQFYGSILLGVLSNRDDDEKAAYILSLSKLDKQKDHEWNDYTRGPGAYLNAVQVYNGLFSAEYELNADFVPPDNLFDENDPEVQKTMTLVKFTNRLFEDEEMGEVQLLTNPNIEGRLNEMLIIDNNELIRLVLERPEDEERIADIVLNEKVSHADVIRAQLDAPVQALRDGAL